MEDQVSQQPSHTLDIAEALTDIQQYRQFTEAIDVPVLANMTEFGRSPLLSHEQLSHMGYAAVLYPVTLLRVAMKAIETMLAVLSTEGTQQELLDLMLTRDGRRFNLLGRPSARPHPCRTGHSPSRADGFGPCSSTGLARFFRVWMFSISTSKEKAIAK